MDIVTIKLNYLIICSDGPWSPPSSVSLQLTDSVAVIKKAIIDDSGYPRSPRKSIFYKVGSATILDDQRGWVFGSNQHQKLEDSDTQTVVSLFPLLNMNSIHIIVEAPEGMCRVMQLDSGGTADFSGIASPWKRLKPTHGLYKMWALAHEDYNANAFFTVRSVERDQPANGINCQSEVLIMRALPGMKELVEDLPEGGILIRDEFVLAIKEVILMAASNQAVRYVSPACKVDGSDEDSDEHTQDDDNGDEMPFDATLLLSFFQQPIARCKASHGGGMIMIGHPGIG